MITNEPIPELIGEKELTGVRLKDGEEVPARILGVGIGIAPELKLLKDAGVEVKKGVLANEYLETNLEDVYTAGDIAEFEDVGAGRQWIVGNWMSAVMQGRVVAKTMAGERTKFELVSSYSANLLGLQVVSIGDTSRKHVDDVEQLVLEDDAAVEVFHKGGRTVGAVLIGDTSRRAAITKAIKDKEEYAS